MQNVVNVSCLVFKNMAAVSLMVFVIPFGTSGPQPVLPEGGLHQWLLCPSMELPRGVLKHK